MNETVIPFVLASLAIYRLSHALASEDGPFALFSRWRKFWLDREVRQGKPNWITDGFHCIMCISFWGGIIAAIVWYFSPNLLFWGSLPFALSAVTVLIKKRYG